ncbi:TPA: hypothetical protein ACX6QA_004304 [Photobacterium damselae]
MKKVNLALLALAVAGSVSIANAAPGDESISKANAKWTGIANIIPGSAHTITGEGGVLFLSEGDLNLQADGRFTSTPIVMESHKLNNAEGDPIEVGDLVDTDWTLESASFDWGTANAAATAGVADGLKFVDQASGQPITKDTPITADKISVTVMNETSITDVVNPTAEATVEATFVSSFIEPAV